MGDISGTPYLYASPFKIGPSLDPLPAKSISMDRPYKVTKELNSICFFFNFPISNQISSVCKEDSG